MESKNNTIVVDQQNRNASNNLKVAKTVDSSLNFKEY